jgi:hypothetical protein
VRVHEHVRPRHTSFPHAEQRVLNSGRASIRVRMPREIIVAAAASAAIQLECCPLMELIGYPETGSR